MTTSLATMLGHLPDGVGGEVKKTQVPAVSAGDAECPDGGSAPDRPGRVSAMPLLPGCLAEEGAAPRDEAAPLTNNDSKDDTSTVPCPQVPESPSSSESSSKIAREHHKVLLDRVIPVAFAEAHGIRSVDLAKIRRFEEKYKLRGLEQFPDLPLHKVTGLLIKYQTCVDEIPRYRVRADRTSYTKPGPIDGSDYGSETVTVPRYICQKGVPVAPYMIDEVLAVASDARVPLFVVEAPLKALSLTANGFTAIGLGGVIAGAHDSALAKEYGAVVASADMKRVDWAGRTTYISYDAGLNDNPMVALGLAYSWRSLRDLGADVKVVRLPYHQPPVYRPEWFEPHDQGPDDFLARFGAEAYQKLVEAAHPADPVARARAVLEGDDAKSEKLARLTELFRDLSFGACLRVGGEATVAGVLLCGKPFGLTKTAVKEVLNEFNDRLSRRLNKDEPGWKKHLPTTTAGAIRPVLRTVSLILSNDTRWAGKIRFDELAQAVEFVEAPPWGPEEIGTHKAEPGRVTEVDVTRTVSWLAREYDVYPAPRVVDDAINMVGRRNPRHAVREYLTGVTWDGTSRIDGWLSTYLGVQSTIYSGKVGAWWLISAVARAMRPGCQVDHVLVLEGPQGSGKTSALRSLGGEWFSSPDIDLRNPLQASLTLAGKWLVELAEGDVFSKSSTQALKAFLTLLHDDIVPKFSNKTERRPRTCAFALTINDSEYLLDHTGNRRYWPVRVGTIDHEALAQARDQLWAEAMVKYKEGAKWYPTTDAERDLLRNEVAEREVTDDWGPAVERAVATLDMVTIPDVLDVLDVNKASRSRSHSLRVGQILRKLGWEQQGRSGLARLWQRGPTAAPKGSGLGEGVDEEALDAALAAAAVGEGAGPGGPVPGAATSAVTEAPVTEVAVTEPISLCHDLCHTEIANDTLVLHTSVTEMTENCGGRLGMAKDPDMGGVCEIDEVPSGNRGILCHSVKRNTDPAAIQPDPSMTEVVTEQQTSLSQPPEALSLALRPLTERAGDRAVTTGPWTAYVEADDGDGDGDEYDYGAWYRQAMAACERDRS